ncbi:MAG: hypothetical protein E7254_09015 [Lachnospiraceae bacterium]|nr:hypothetical protein [Lachnospiraceae bacterium]
MNGRIKKIIAVAVALVIVVAGINFTGVSSSKVVADSSVKYNLTVAVYEGIVENVVKEANLTFYYKESANAQETQVNLETLEGAQSGDDGTFTFRGDEGMWRVAAEKEGYEVTYSDWYTVSSDTTMYVKMCNDQMPKVEYVKAYETACVIKFSQYMDFSTFSNIIITDEMGIRIFYRVNYDKSGSDHNGKLYAKDFTFHYTDGKPEIGSFLQISFNFGVKDCLGRDFRGFILNPRVYIDGNSSEIETSIDVQIAGWQMNAYAPGIRVDYCIPDVIGGKNVEKVGLVYGLGELANENDLFVGNPDWFVKSFDATERGKIDFELIPGSNTYSMTMLFTGYDNPVEFTDLIRVRAYALLEDGTYLYSYCIDYSVYKVALDEYEGSWGIDKYSHDYVYNKIIKLVDPNAEPIEYNPTWKNEEGVNPDQL